MGSCREMDKEEIRELRGFYVDAAVRAREAGFDLILVYGAEASPITQQFLMPYFNKRMDEYGGSFENRARFFREVIESVREAAGDDCAIGVRFSIDTLRDDELGVRVEEDGVAFIEHVDHLVDLWDVQVGGRVVAEWMDAAGPSRFRTENFQSHGSRRSDRTPRSRSWAWAGSRARTQWSKSSGRASLTSSEPPVRR